MRANDIIAAQQKADDAKKVREEYEAERRADLMRREHSMLVAERLKKTAILAQLKEQRDGIEADVSSNEGERGALVARLQALQREEEELTAELDLEVATTPRYEHMAKRSRKLADAARNRCAIPQREVARLIDAMRRTGGSYLSHQLDAASLVAKQKRTEAALRNSAKSMSGEVVGSGGQKHFSCAPPPCAMCRPRSERTDGRPRDAARGPTPVSTRGAARCGAVRRQARVLRAGGRAVLYTTQRALLCTPPTERGLPSSPAVLGPPDAQAHSLDVSLGLSRAHHSTAGAARTSPSRPAASTAGAS